MAFIPVGFAELVFHINLANDLEDMLCTIGIEVTDAVTPADLLTFMNDRAWTPLFEAAMTEDYTVTKLVALVGQDPPPPVVVEKELNLPGNTTTDPVTSNTSLLVKKTTGVGGRANRGRMYVPGAPAVKVAPNGSVESAFRGDIQDDLDDIIAAAPADPFGGYVVLHTDDSVEPTPITNLTLEAVVATQRRRLRP